MSDSMFAPSDGVLLGLPPTALHPGNNVHTALDRHAPRSAGLTMALEDIGGSVVDTFYGIAYRGLPMEGAEPYGRSSSVNRSRIEALADRDLGFLRVPFKRIPRIRCRDVNDIQRIVDHVATLYPRERLLFRGQTREWLLHRSAAFSQRFYGELAVDEPSLTASASRVAKSIETCIGELMMWVQIWQRGTLENLAQTWASDRRVVSTLVREVERRWYAPHFYFHTLALAQHYGLPSVGLDVTNRLDVALFFSLREFRKNSNTSTYTPIDPTAQPVLYILLREGSREFPFSEAAPRIMQHGRPAAQSAWFMHVGWGYGRNVAADQILAALYLDPAGDYGAIPTSRELFPGPEADTLGGFLTSLRGRASPQLSSILANLYWIE